MSSGIPTCQSKTAFALLMMLTTFVCIGSDKLRAQSNSDLQVPQTQALEEVEPNSLIEALVQPLSAPETQPDSAVNGLTSFIDNVVLSESLAFVTEVARGENWLEILAAFQTALFGNLFATGIVLMLFLVGFVCCQGLLSHSDRIVKIAIRDESMSSMQAASLVASTLTASFLCWSPVLAIGIFFGWYGRQSGLPTEFIGALGSALLALFAAGFFFRTIQEFLSKGGLSEAIYGVKPFTARFILNQVDVAALALGPLLSLFAFVCVYQNGRWYDSIGRLIFLGIAVILFGQFHKFFQPHSKLYRRIENDEALGNANWIQYRFAIYCAGVSVFLLTAGMTTCGWFELAKVVSIKAVVTLAIGLGVVSIRTIVSKRVDELIRKTNFVEDLGQSVEASATVRSRQVNQFVKRYNRVAQQSIGFLSVVMFFAASIWIWSDLISIPERVMQLNVAGLVTIVQIVLIGLATAYLARQLPGFVIWICAHHTKTNFKNARAISTLISMSILFAGLICVLKMTSITVPAIPWLGTILVIAFLIAGKTTLSDFIAGISLVFDPRVKEGDCIEIEGRFGRVMEVNLLTTVIEDNLGTKTIVPNQKLLGETIVASRDSDVFPILIDVSLPRDSDAHQAQAIMLLVAQRAECVVQIPPPHVKFAGFANSELKFQIRVLLQASADAAKARTRILEKLSIEFERHSILEPIAPSFKSADAPPLKIYQREDRSAA